MLIKTIHCYEKGDPATCSNNQQGNVTVWEACCLEKDLHALFVPLTAQQHGASLFMARPRPDGYVGKVFEMRSSQPCQYIKDSLFITYVTPGFCC